MNNMNQKQIQQIIQKARNLCHPLVVGLKDTDVVNIKGYLHALNNVSVLVEDHFEKEELKYGKNMETELITLEEAKAYHAKGVKQESKWYWIKDNNNPHFYLAYHVNGSYLAPTMKEEKVLTHLGPNEVLEKYSAFSKTHGNSNN